METSLYQPVKTFLEAAGYEVKGEVGGCDLVGLAPADPSVVVICELKLSFNLELILQAAAMPSDMVHAEGKIFVLDMGEPVRIQDLARQMIRLAGRQPDKDVKIVFTGLRPGEKLYEEVLHSAEATVPTPQEGVMLAAPRTIDRAELDRAIAGLIAHAQQRDTAALMAGIAALVPEFRHAPNGQAAAVPASAA